jgi:hypothetical protein
MVLKEIEQLKIRSTWVQKCLANRGRQTASKKIISKITASPKVARATQPECRFRMERISIIAHNPCLAIGFDEKTV